MLAIAGLLAGVVDAAAQTGHPLRHFQCFNVRPPQRAPEAEVTLEDQFGSFTATIDKAAGVCAPANKNGEEPDAVDDPVHLVSYSIERTGAFTPIVRQHVRNQFGTLDVDLLRPARLLVPSLKSLAEPPGSPVPAVLDHFTCYRVQRSSGQPKPERRTVTVATQFDEATIDLVKPLRLCTPANKNGEDPTAPERPADVQNHLLCYRMNSNGGLGKTRVFLNNQFGPQEHVINQRREFCVPSLLNFFGTTTSSSTTTSTSSTAVTTTSTTSTTSTSTSSTTMVSVTSSSSSSSTSTSSTTSTSTSSTTTTTLAAVCGNGNTEPGETCDDGNTLDGDACPANCVIAPCTPVVGSARPFSVFFTPPDGLPSGEGVAGITVLVNYPEGRVSIPGSGGTLPAGTITNTPSGAFAQANDLDYALREVIASGDELPVGRLLTINFNDCQGATPPVAGNFTCTVEDAADPLGFPIGGVTCTVMAGS